MAKSPYQKDHVAGQKQPLTLDQVAAISTRLTALQAHRDHALFRVAIDSMLRASDLVRVLREDIWDEEGRFIAQVHVRMKKTREVVRFELSAKTKAVLEAYRPMLGYGKWLFPGNAGQHLCEARYRQLCKEWFRAVGLDVRFYSTHSLRRTKATAIYRETANLKAVSRLLGHRTTDITEHYIGIGQKEALEIARKVEI